MRRIILVSFAFLVSCVSPSPAPVKQINPTITQNPGDEIDQKMFHYLYSAAKKYESGDSAGAIKDYKTCMSLKPNPTDLGTSQPRRWCQNNIINVILQCEIKPECDKTEALSLAKELVEFNPVKNMDVAYSGTLAKAYAGVGDYEIAAQEMERVIGFMGNDHQWRSSYIMLLNQFKAKASISDPSKQTDARDPINE